jgi:antitoxin (DNA-binding transcriptional repressor) of toxin-antitoxin stability system
MVAIMETQFSKSQFKANALEILRRVEATGEPVLVTDHGKPTIEVRRHRSLARSPLDLLRGSVVDYRDPTEPVGEQDWEALE